MQTKQYKLNLPPATRDKIKALAADNHRSMSAEIIHRLEQTLEADEPMNFHCQTKVDAT